MKRGYIMLKSKKRRILKGFTLVEVLVVLVILAILASMSIGAFTGYIDRAKNREAALEAKRWFIAAQAAVTEAYGLSNLVIERGGDTIDDVTFKPTDEGLFVLQKIIPGGEFDSYTFGAVQTMTNRSNLAGNEKIAALTLQYMDSLNDDGNNEFTFAAERNPISGETRPADYFKNNPNKYSVSISYNDKGQVRRLVYAREGFDRVVIMGQSDYSIEDAVSIRERKHEK